MTAEQIEAVTGTENLVKNDGNATPFFHPRAGHPITFFNLNKLGARITYHLASPDEADDPQVGAYTTIYGTQLKDAFQSDAIGQLRVIASSQAITNTRSITRNLDVPTDVTAVKSGPSTLEFRDENSIVVGSIKGIRGYIGDTRLRQINWSYSNGEITFSTDLEPGQQGFMIMFEYSPFVEATGIEGKTR